MSQPDFSDQSLDALASRLSELKPAPARLSRDELFYMAGKVAGRPLVPHGYLVVALMAILTSFLLARLGLQHRQLVQLHRQVTDLRALVKSQADPPALAQDNRASSGGAPKQVDVQPTPVESPGQTVPHTWAISELMEMPTVARGHFAPPVPADPSRSAAPPPTPWMVHDVVRGIAELESGAADPQPAGNFF